MKQQQQQQISTPIGQFGFRHSLQIQSSPNIKLYQQSPLLQSPLLQQPSLSQQQRQQMNINNDIQNQKCKQLQLVDLNHIEEPWKLKVLELQRKVQQLEQQQQQNEECDYNESELSQVYSQIQQLVNTIKILQEENQNLQEKLRIKQNIIDNYDSQLISKDKELEDQNNYIQELHNQLEDQTLLIDNKKQFLFDEINSWKRKYIEQNKGLHKIQEESIMIQTQIDNLKNINMMLNKQSQQT